MDYTRTNNCTAKRWAVRTLIFLSLALNCFLGYVELSPLLAGHEQDAKSSFGSYIQDITFFSSNNNDTAGTEEVLSLPSRGILIIDTRHPDTSILPTLTSVLENTDSAWQVQLICPPAIAHQLGDGNTSKFRSLVESHGRTLYITGFDQLVSGALSYEKLSDFSTKVALRRNHLTTNIMRDPQLWETVQFDKILVIQPDAVMCKSGLDAFLQYDYIGAPWTKDYNGLMVGNGGFSLRTKSAMIQCAQTYKFKSKKKRIFNEDIFYAHCVHDNPNMTLPGIWEARKFAMENDYFPEMAMAFHKPVLHERTPEREREMCDICPAIKDIPEIGLNCDISISNGQKVENTAEAQQHEKNTISICKCVDCQEDQLCGGLWRGSRYPNMSSLDQVTGTKIRIVIAHCNKSLDWFSTNFKKFTNIASIHIISKCGEQVQGAPSEAIVVKRPNVGRNDEAYAYYLASILPNIISSPEDDNSIVFFVKDNFLQPVFHAPWFFRIRLESLAHIALSSNGFGCGLGIDSVNWSMYHDTTTLFSFVMQKYEKGEREYQTEDGVPFQSEFGNLGEFYKSLNAKPLDELVKVCYGGLFAATTSNIFKQDVKLWETLEKSLQRGDNIQEGHYAERIWGALLATPLEPFQMKALRDHSTSIKHHKALHGSLFKWTPKGTPGGTRAKGRKNAPKSL